MHLLLVTVEQLGAFVEIAASAFLDFGLDETFSMITVRKSGGDAL